MSDWSAVERLASKLRRFPRVFGTEVDDTTARYGHLLLEAVKRHASGRPGPNIRTGAYVSHFQLHERPGLAKVTNPSPQTHRLEYGFTGTDVLGRTYAQPPFPHFRPALAEVKPQYIAALRRLPGKVWRES